MSETELEESIEANTGSNVESTVDDMRWYVVQAYSGFEKRVQQSMQTRIDRSDLTGAFLSILQFHYIFCRNQHLSKLILEV
jgi:hypothetical protein